MIKPNTNPDYVYPVESWQWYGSAGHFICGRWCRFHLATTVGPWLVSTVGEYVHPRHSNGNEHDDHEWVKENWPGENIGHNRKFETMVFRAGPECSCGCGMPLLLTPRELDFNGYNDHKSARAGHMQLCYKWANITEEEVKSYE